MNHFDEMTAFLYLDGQLERAQASEVLVHTKDCADCRELLESLKKETLWLEQSLQEKDPVPAQFMAPARRANVPWGWVTALGFAVAGTLTVWNGMIEPFEQQLNQAGFTGGNLMTMLFFSGAFWKGWSNVLSFFGFFAATMFAILMFVLLVRFWRRGATVSMVLASFFTIALLFATPQRANAAKVFRGTPKNPSYELPAGQTVNDNLIVFGESTRINGTVDGDVIAFSNAVEVTGHVTGDVISFAKEVRIDGQVDGNVRSGSSTLWLSGTVGKNVTSEGGTIEVDSKGRVGGEVIALGGTVELDGKASRGLMALTGDTIIDGQIDGDAHVRSNNLRIGSQATITGHTSYEGNHQAVVEPGANLASPIAFTLRRRTPNYASWRYWWHHALFWGAAFLFGLVLLLLTPGFFNDGLRSSRKFLPSLGFGALFMFATPIVAAIVCFTIVGIGVAITTLLFWLIALYAAQVFVATWLGEILLGHSLGTGALLGRLALGLAILHALELIPYHVGFLVKLVVLWWGLGAIAIALYGHLRRPTAIPVPAAA